MPLVEFKDFNALIDNKPSIDQPVEKTKKRMKDLSKYQGMMTNATENVLDYLYCQKHYKLIGIDLTRQKKYKYS